MTLREPIRYEPDKYQDLMAAFIASALQGGTKGRDAVTSAMESVAGMEVALTLRIDDYMEKELAADIRHCLASVARAKRDQGEDRSGFVSVAWHELEVREDVDSFRMVGTVITLDFDDVNAERYGDAIREAVHTNPHILDLEWEGWSDDPCVQRLTLQSGLKLGVAA